MNRKGGLVRKLTKFFIILLLSVSLLTGLTTYVYQRRIYMDECQHDLRTLVRILADLMSSDGKEFSAYQEMTLRLGDKVRIPIDYDGDYRPAKLAFYEKYNQTYAGKGLGSDVDYLDMSEELQILFVTYKQEYWLHTFDTAKKNLGAIYAYYVVPTGEKLHMYYMVDAVMEPYTVAGKEYVFLNIDVEQDLEMHEHMWATWESGTEVQGYDTYDNEFGKTYACYYPLWINGEKLGVVCADMEIEKVSRAILFNSIRQSLLMFALLVILCAVLSFAIGKRYIARLIWLKRDVSEFTENKDPALAERIIGDIKGNDEITDLAKQIATMIEEIGTYMNTLIDKNRELTEAQYKIRAANELANKDALTGIRNKTAYDNEIKKIEQNMASEGFYKYGIAMVDLNYLKVINDTYGHEKGNAAIKKICMIVCKIFSHSPVFRIGGDEFVVILENEDYDNTEEQVQAFRDTLDDIAQNDSLEPWEKVSAAIGWTKYDPQKDDGMESVFKRADGLMYENKLEMKAARQ